jgi:hypothetical protein
MPTSLQEIFNHDDLTTHISTYLNIQKLSRIRLVCKNWSKLFLSPKLWKEKIMQDFNVPLASLNALESVANENTAKPYQRFYQILYTLTRAKDQKILPKHLAFNLAEFFKEPLYLACCFDDTDYFFSHAEQINDYMDMCLINIYSGHHRITERLLQSGCDLVVIELVKAALMINNISLLHLIIDQRLAAFSLPLPLQELINLAKNLGCFELVKAELEPKFKGRLDELILNVIFHPNKSIQSIDGLLSDPKKQLEIAVKLGDFNSVKKLTAPPFNLLLDATHVNMAAASGNVDLVKKLTAPPFNLLPDATHLNTAAASGSVDLVQYLLEPAFNLKVSQLTLQGAVRSGNLILVQWLIESFNLKPDKETNDLLNQQLIQVALQGDLEAVKKLTAPPFSLKPKSPLLTDAVTSRNLALVQYLLTPAFRLSPTKNALQRAAALGDLTLVQTMVPWLSKIDLYPDQQTLYQAAKSGNLKLVQWLIKSSKIAPNKSTVDGAVESGNSILLQWLMKSFKFKQVQKSSLAGLLHGAVERGDLDTVKKLTAPPFDLQPAQGDLYIAAISGNLALVQYLLTPAFNLNISQHTLQEAAASGNLTLLKLLIVKAFNLIPDEGTLNGAAKSGNLKLFQWLMTPPYNLKPNEVTLKEAVLYGSLAIIQFLLAPPYNLKPNIDMLRVWQSNSEHIQIQKKENQIVISRLLLDLQYNYDLSQLKWIQKNFYHNKPIEILTSNIAFREGLQAAQAGLFSEEAFNQSYQASPEHFYHLLNKVLLEADLLRNKIAETIFKDLLSLDIVQKTPLPESQLALAEYAREGRYLKLDDKTLYDLYTKAQAGFELMGKRDKASIIAMASSYINEAVASSEHNNAYRSEATAYHPSKKPRL